MNTLVRTKIDSTVDMPAQYIRIKPGEDIEARLFIVSFVDKDTHQHIAYCPSLDITGYGKNVRSANKILDFNLNQFYNELYHHSLEEQKSMLVSLGWKMDNQKRKSFSMELAHVEGEFDGF
jgi:hypothetical protein